MKIIGMVQGGLESAIPFYICVDTVYLRFNIEKAERPQGEEELDSTGTEDTEVYQWFEIQYTLAEWLNHLTENMIDVSSFALNGALIQTLDEKAESLQATIPVLADARAAAYDEMGTSEKLFTFNIRFQQRR